MDNRTDEVLLRFLCLPWAASVRPSDAPLKESQATALVRCALAQDLGPILYDRLRGYPVLPPTSMAHLRQAYYENAGRNAHLWHALEIVLRALAASGVPTMLLKGAALAQAVYGNPALRPMGDLDLFVRPADAPRAMETLASIGYRPIRPPLRPTTLTTDESQVFLRHGGVNLELHWGLLDFPYYVYSMPVEEIWANARPISIGTASAWMLSPEDQVMYLCAHLVLHHGEHRLRLLWLCDIAEVIVQTGEKLDWAALLERAQAYNLLLPLQSVLPQLADAWQVPIPPAALERLREARPSPAERRLHNRLASHRRSVARRFWENLAGRPTWTERLRFAWSNLFPSPAYMRERYAIHHPLLLPFYYLYRWILGLCSALHPEP